MKNIFLLLAFCGATFSPLMAQQQTSLSPAFDKLVKEQLQGAEAGATVLVSSKGKIIYKKAFGKANIELGTPMQADHVFRIGSVTKQFTAMAILRLMEQGKLNLQDQITRFIPGYPMQGEQITIEHLLTHTSGIRDYASIKDSTQQSKVDISPEEMIRDFQNYPKRFAPGSRYEYSNSNYFLLGYIIEKITGNKYAQYLQEHFFRPLGMAHSFYGDDKKIIPNRAAGYSKNQTALENAEALSMSRSYAAGSVLSTVEDLFKWQQAVQSYQLVKKETLDKAFTRYRLNNGKTINYGYGWRFGFIQESPSIWHGGLINGFMSMAMYLPKEDVYVAVLSNCNCFSPEIITAKLAAIAIGKPYDYKEITVPDSLLQKYAGLYENEEGDEQLISVAEGKLYSQRGRNPRVHLRAFKEDHFFLEDPMVSVEFRKSKEGKQQLIVKSRLANEVWNRSAKAPGTQVEMKVDEATLQLYTGEYEVNSQFGFTVSREKDRLFLQGTGQDKLELFAESSNKFFLKVNDATLEFVNEGGRITKAILKQGGRTADAPRIK